MAEFVKFSSNEDCAKALYQYLINNGHITAREPFVQANNLLHDINNLRGYEWLELLPRNAETEAFFAYLDPEYLSHLISDKAEYWEAFIFDNSITPGEYWELLTGEAGVVVSGLDALRVMMDEAGFDEVWDYPVADIDEAVANNDHLVLVDDGETVNYPNNACRVFEVTDEMYSRYVKMYGKAHGVEEADKTKADVLDMFNRLKEMEWGPAYFIALDMVSILHEAKGAAVENFGVDEAYLLAAKLNDAMSGWFTAPISRGEYVCAVSDLLENGITRFNNPNFDELDAASTLKLLLDADDVVFGTLVESTAVQNCYRYLPDDYRLDEKAADEVVRAIEAGSANIDEVLAKAATAVKQINDRAKTVVQDVVKD